jgi:Rps23 Pro-64 3,4-dihydroxylase Tpa1-like proline 4-hydroxylase
MLGEWASDVPAKAAEYKAGEPFPLVIIDNFLEESFADKLLSEFPVIDKMDRSKDYVFGDKREQAKFESAGPNSQAYYDFLMSDEFAQVVSTISGETLFMDPHFHGGGFHQSGDGGFLDTHVDFNIHPEHKDWLRVLNILLYLNKDWKPEYDGNLLVRTDPKNEPRAVAPLFNRCVMMWTSDITFHGFRKMSLPAGVSRKSIAGYAYKIVDPNEVKARTTSWEPENANAAKRALAKHWTGLSAAKNKVSGR